MGSCRVVSGRGHHHCVVKMVVVLFLAVKGHDRGRGHSVLIVSRDDGCSQELVGGRLVAAAMHRLRCCCVRRPAGHL